MQPMQGSMAPNVMPADRSDRKITIGKHTDLHNTELVSYVSCPMTFHIAIKPRPRPSLASSSY